MKKIISIMLIASLSALISCDENVNPKAASEDKYVFYCIINSDTTFQTAYLSRTYNTQGVNPMENKTNPAITSARVVVSYKDKEYLFADSSVDRTDTSRYKDNFHFYYNNKLKILSTNIRDVPNSCSVKVTFPRMTLISKIETIPTGDFFFNQYSYDFPGPENYEFSWNFFSSDNSIRKYYFLPVLEINYSKVENGVPVRKKARIPNRTYYLNNTKMPVYPKISNSPGVNYNKQYIIDAFNNISAGDANKKNYIIHNLEFSVIIMEKNLAAYYASSSTFNDEFSMRIDAADYSNIRGGYGIFGLYATKKKYISLFQSYLINLGYRYEPKM